MTRRCLILVGHFYYFLFLQLAHLCSPVSKNHPDIGFSGADFDLGEFDEDEDEESPDDLSDDENGEEHQSGSIPEEDVPVTGVVQIY
jgi:hypothetical protein